MDATDDEHLRMLEELVALRKECDNLRAALRAAPSVYLAALVGIVQGQRNPGADRAERAERARAIERQIVLIASHPAPEPVRSWAGHQVRVKEIDRDLRHFSGDKKWTSVPSAGSAPTAPGNLAGDDNSAKDGR